MVAAADLRIEVAAGRQRHPQQANDAFPDHAVLETALHGHLVGELSTLAEQPEQFGDAVAERPQVFHPALDVGNAPFVVMVEPVGVVRQVELAGTAGYGTAMLDGSQELAVADRLHELRPDGEQALPEVLQVVQHALQPRLVDPGNVLVAVIDADLALQLLQHVTADVATAEDRDDVEHARDGAATAPFGVLLHVEAQLLVEELEAQEGAHPLAQRLLVEPRDAGCCSLREQVDGRNADHE